MNRVLLSLLLFCLTGCDGPVFRRVGGPSAGKLRAAVQSNLTNYLTVHELSIVAGNDGGDVRVLQFDLEVSPMVPLFSPEGANPPGEEVFRLRRTHPAGERVTLHGSVTATGTPSEWRFGRLEWRKDPTAPFGRPRDYWPGSYVIEGTPEAEAAIQARIKAKEAQLELARKAKEAEAEQARRAQAEREAIIEAERLKREQEALLERRRQELARENEARARREAEERRQREREEEIRQRRLAEEAALARMVEFRGRFAPGREYNGNMEEQGKTKTLNLFTLSITGDTAEVDFSVGTGWKARFSGQFGQSETGPVLILKPSANLSSGYRVGDEVFVVLQGIVRMAPDGDALKGSAEFTFPRTGERRDCTFRLTLKQ